MALKAWFKLLTITFLCVSLSGHGFGRCGCKSCGDDFEVMEKGNFIDSGVRGLTYKSVNLEETKQKDDVTFIGGQFYFYRGGNVSFYLGKNYLGKVQDGNDIRFDAISPLNLVSEANNNINNGVVVNMIRLLQSLDEDENPENGIIINSEMQNLLNKTSFNFELDQNVFEDSVFQSGVLDIISPGKRLIERENALAHFKATLTDKAIPFEEL